MGDMAELDHQGVGNRLLVAGEEPMRSANSNAPVEHRERLADCSTSTFVALNERNRHSAQDDHRACTGSG
jgi:hypothetical protein